jgi:hypothetical protein
VRDRQALPDGALRADRGKAGAEQGLRGQPAQPASYPRSASIDEVYQRPHRHHIGVMPHLDLSDEETAALAAPLTRTIADDRYPLSLQVRTLKAILAKLRPERLREPLPPPKVYAPPRATAARRRPRG